MSASVRSSSFGAGSSDKSRRDVPFGDDAREWNDGGGDAGGHC